MIPEMAIDLTILEEDIQPSKTYQLDLTRKRMTNIIDGKEAVLQAAMKILNTERYAQVIYSSQYGTELERFIGQDYDFIAADIKRILSEALMADNRIIEIIEFQIQKVGSDSMEISLKINTLEGEININTEMMIA